jgi:hypothetical protein
VLHRLGGEDALLVFPPGAPPPALLERRGHRAIGVVYRPAYEALGNYVPTVLPRRYDALLFLDRTRALAPLHMPERAQTEPPETYPSGM